MPVSRIEVKRRRSAEQVQALIEAVRLSQCEALKVPEHDRQIRYIEHQPEHFAAPPGKTDDYTLVEICLFPGRTRAAKKALYRAIVTRFEALGIPRDHVFIVLREEPLDNWGIRGGQIASEVELGFKLDV